MSGRTLLIVVTTAVLALATPLVVPRHVEAQGALVVGGAQANFGFHEILPVAPEQLRVTVRSGGSVNARNLGIGFDCIGWVTPRPDFILRLQRAAGSVRLHVAAAEDTSLVVNTAVGTWRCNDDADGTLEPTVLLQGAAAGRYDVWVGAVHARRVSEGVLVVDLTPSPPRAVSPVD